MCVCVCVERERERESERLCPSVKWWKHRNGTISIIQDLHVSLLIGVCIERKSKRERLCPTVKLWRNRNGTISIIWDLHIFLSVGDYIEGEAMSICGMVKTQKWYYLCNMRSVYFPINRRLHRERARERERGYVHPWNGQNTEMVLSP